MTRPTTTVLAAGLAMLFASGAMATSLGGTCSNWMTSSLASQDSGSPEAAATRAACTALQASGDFKTHYEPRTNTCLICASDDWTPTTQTPPVDGGRPDLSRTYGGDYHIEWTNGKGWYKNKSQTIEVTNVEWDDRAKEWLVTGKWGRVGKTGPRSHGYFAFYFKNSCTFDGYWWYSDQDWETGYNGRNGFYGWDGHCK